MNNNARTILDSLGCVVSVLFSAKKPHIFYSSTQVIVIIIKNSVSMIETINNFRFFGIRKNVQMNAAIEMIVAA